MEHDLETLNREAENIVKNLGIPPCPAILTKLIQEMRGDDPDFQKLGKLIAGDASLAAAMLKTVNSPFYGLRTRATSIHQAITLLGVRNVAQLVTGLLLRQAFPGGTNELMDDYWESTSKMAELNGSLARKIPGMDRATAHTFALFRDCGMLAMIGKYKDYKPVLPGKKADKNKSVLQVEDERYQMNHARVGYHLAKSWLLTDEICYGILHHHDFNALESGVTVLPGAGARLVALALLSDKVFNRQELGLKSSEWDKGRQFALKQLGLTPDKVDDLVSELMAA